LRPAKISGIIRKKGGKPVEKNMQTGKRIQARREELGLNLGDIAQKVGVAVSTIQRYEKGKPVGKIDQLRSEWYNKGVF
jgi:predicted transcriptional regulator